MEWKTVRSLCDQWANPYNSQADPERVKAALAASGLSNDAKRAVVYSFYGEDAPTDKNAFANSIDSIEGLSRQFKLKLLALRFQAIPELSAANSQ
jgi:hypothetical protein